MNKNWKIAALALSIIALMGTGVGAAYATSTSQARANDHVLIGTHHDFEEYFKRDAESKGAGQQHNNIYTVSEVVPAPPVGKCVVVTGDSEKTIAVSCNYGQNGEAQK